MTLSTFGACCQTTEQLCPPASSSQPACLQTPRLTFIRRSDRPAAADIGGKYTYGEHKSRSADSHAPGTTSLLTQYLSVTGIWDAPALQPAWLGAAGVAAENNYLCAAVGGHLQRRFPIPTAAVTGRRRRRMQNTPSPLKPANQGASELSAPATLRLPPQPLLWKTPALLFANRLQSAALSTLASSQSGVTRA